MSGWTSAPSLPRESNEEKDRVARFMFVVHVDRFIWSLLINYIGYYPSYLVFPPWTSDILNHILVYVCLNGVYCTYLFFCLAAHDTGICVLGGYI